jgi:hypothetical protein
VADLVALHVIEQFRQALGEAGEIDVAVGIDEHGFGIR